MITDKNLGSLLSAISILFFVYYSFWLFGFQFLPTNLLEELKAGSDHQDGLVGFNQTSTNLDLFAVFLKTLYPFPHHLAYELPLLILTISVSILGKTHFLSSSANRLFRIFYILCSHHGSNLKMDIQDD